MIFQTVCMGVNKSGLAMGITKHDWPIPMRSALPVKKEGEKLGQGILYLLDSIWSLIAQCH